MHQKTKYQEKKIKRGVQKITWTSSSCAGRVVNSRSLHWTRHVVLMTEMCTEFCCGNFLGTDDMEDQDKGIKQTLRIKILLIYIRLN
jgi:hypothetical protein